MVQLKLLINMKQSIGKQLFCFLVAFLLAACSPTDINNLSCNVDAFLEANQDMQLKGPIDLADTQELYERKVLKFTTAKEEKWMKFKNAMNQGGCIFQFSSSEKSWESLAGGEGLLLLKDGKLFDVFYFKIS